MKTIGNSLRWTNCRLISRSGYNRTWSKKEEEEEEKDDVERRRRRERKTKLRGGRVREGGKNGPVATFTNRVVTPDRSTLVQMVKSDTDLEGNTAR